MKRLDDDKAHTDSCHERWMKLRNRRQEEPTYKNEWYGAQCGACAYFIPLQGGLASDYGACSNASARFDRHVMFEHDGCESFVAADEDD